MPLTMEIAAAICCPEKRNPESVSAPEVSSARKPNSITKDLDLSSFPVSYGDLDIVVLDFHYREEVDPKISASPFNSEPGEPEEIEIYEIALICKGLLVELSQEQQAIIIAAMETLLEICIRCYVEARNEY